MPRQRNVGQELPHLRKKYRGGYWGFGHELKTTSLTPQNCSAMAKLSLMSP